MRGSGRIREIPRTTLGADGTPHGVVVGTNRTESAFISSGVRIRTNRTGIACVVRDNVVIGTRGTGGALCRPGRSRISAKRTIDTRVAPGCAGIGARTARKATCLALSTLVASLRTSRTGRGTNGVCIGSNGTWIAGYLPRVRGERTLRAGNTGRAIERSRANRTRHAHPIIGRGTGRTGRRIAFTDRRHITECAIAFETHGGAGMFSVIPLGARKTARLPGLVLIGIQIANRTGRCVAISGIGPWTAECAAGVEVVIGSGFASTVAVRANLQFGAFALAGVVIGTNAIGAMLSLLTDTDRPLEEFAARNGQIDPNTLTIIGTIETTSQIAIGWQCAIDSGRNVIEDGRTIGSRAGRGNRRTCARTIRIGIKPDLNDHILEWSGTNILGFQRTMCLSKNVYRGR